MASLNSTIVNICKKYASLDPSIIEERNSILNAKEFVNTICNMITTRTSEDDLTRQIMCSSLGGGQKVLTEIIETNEELGTSNFNNTISWKWTKAQLKVNEQRDEIDKLICEVVKAIVKKNSVENVFNDSLSLNSEPNEYEAENNESEPEPTDSESENNEHETYYLENVKQKTLKDYETYLVIKSFLYAVIGALFVNIFVAYLNLKY